ncbi:MAG: restriction endonuclease [Hyphomonas sp.]|nr:restriction endonuclease [Hyphomonas sp.]
MSYNYSNLSDADFEDLVRDLLGRLLGVRFEGFGRGPDGGVDGRHAKGGETTVLQAKHYQGSNFSALKSAMKKERASIDKLQPERYLLATSRSLQPANKKTLKEVIGPYLQEEGDVFGREDLDALLRKYPDIEKAHVKLWLSSTAVLEKVVHAATVAYSETTKAEIEAKVRVYAQNPSLSEARDKLEKEHVVIISGPPGVGKTTLAEMLSFAYIAEGWEFISIRSLDDGFARIDDSKRQIFLFDDFLGRVALDAQSLAAKDAVLVKFLKRVAASHNARFILTTRAYILEGARRLSEHLAGPQIDVTKFMLDVSAYTRRIKARILYNHLDAAGVPATHVEALRESDSFVKIVDHKNYSPRIIEAMTESIRFKNLAGNDYPAAFIGALDNPNQIWDVAFRTHINDAGRHLLYAIQFSSEYGVGVDELRVAFDSLHRHQCEKYGHSFRPKDFEETLRTLEGGFLAIRGTSVSFVNPSVRDYLTQYLNNAEMLADFAKTSRKVKWAEAVWKHAKRPGLLTQEQLVMVANNCIDVAREFAKLPVMKRDPKRSNTWLFYDAHYGERVQLLLEWWDVTRDEAFSELVLPCAQEAVRRMSAWRDGPSFVDAIVQLREGEYREFPNAEALAQSLEGHLLTMLEGALNTEDLDSIFAAIEEAKEVLNSAVYDAVVSAVHAEVSNVSEYVRWEDSESTLSEHKEVLEKLAKKVGVLASDLAEALDIIQSRIEEIQERAAPEAEAPLLESKSLSRSEKFDDDDIRVLFDTLRAEG